MQTPKVVDLDVKAVYDGLRAILRPGPGIRLVFNDDAMTVDVRIGTAPEDATLGMPATKQTPFDAGAA